MRSHQWELGFSRLNLGWGFRFGLRLRLRFGNRFNAGRVLAEWWRNRNLGLLNGGLRLCFNRLLPDFFVLALRQSQSLFGIVDLLQEIVMAFTGLLYVLLQHRVILVRLIYLLRQFGVAEPKTG